MERQDSSIGARRADGVRRRIAESWTRRSLRRTAGIWLLIYGACTPLEPMEKGGAEPLSDAASDGSTDEADGAPARDAMRGQDARGAPLDDGATAKGDGSARSNDVDDQDAPSSEPDATRAVQGDDASATSPNQPPAGEDAGSTPVQPGPAESDAGSMMSGCSPETCPDGCCAGDRCVPFATQNTMRCGAGGKACGACAAAQECSAAGACVCTPRSCPDGCCKDGACVALPQQNDAACGKAGAACGACAAGEACSAGTCSCGADSCDGCCRDGACVRASDMACGAGGASCSACAPGTRCGGGECVCDRTSCPTGCCDASGACQAASATACGTGGAMCRACMLAHATARCEAGGCAVASCERNFGDCDGADANGCEVNLTNTLAHCGACAQPCAPRENATVSCAASRCEYKCKDGYREEGGRCVSTSVWYDSSMGLHWQVIPTGRALLWSAAVSHCEALNLGGFSDWRLPSIGELRSLVRGCASTHINGACTISDECSASSCDDSSCLGCGDSMGPDGGCYWATEMEGSCGPSYSYWSSTNYSPGTGYAWVLGYDRARFAERDKTTGAEVRCVRGP